jgi:CDP-diacylglycerol pyrophosphatase
MWSLGVIAVGAVIGWQCLKPNSNALLALEHTECLDQHAQTPCILVDRQQGYVMMKDQNGSRHYLLLPIVPLRGIESAILLAPGSPNYFALAWSNRGILSTGLPAQIPAQDILLAINSKVGRNQDQMHIHIACIDPGIRDRLSEIDPTISEVWTQIPDGLANHRYWARRVTPAEFAKSSPFRLFVSGFPEAGDKMGDFSLAVTGTETDDIILLATEWDPFDFNLASTEELQDEDCRSIR